MNRFKATLDKRGKMMFTALVQYKNRKRENKVTLSASQVLELKKAKTRDAFFKLVDRYIVTPCKIDSAAKKAGLTKNTGYDGAHSHTAKLLGVKV